jgi:hypothetical protein
LLKSGYGIRQVPAPRDYTKYGGYPLNRVKRLNNFLYLPGVMLLSNTPSPRNGGLQIDQ